MHILCTICSDLVNQAENIYVTKCGHIFHHHCLAQWIERSKSCPQCRYKVTEKCMFRLYPTISNESCVDDAAMLQSRLDDAQLHLRQTKAACQERDNKLTALTTDLKRNEDLLRSYEKKLVSRDSAVAALKEQLEYVKIQNLETNRLKEENEALKKNIQTLNGLQKVLNSTAEEVENMLKSYSDIRTLAVFATALKGALCESESKKNESRDRVHAVKHHLAVEKKNVADLQAKLLQLEDRLSNTERKYQALKNKRKASDENEESTREESAKKQMRKSASLVVDFNTAMLVDDNSSFNSMVNKIETADSPYLNLKQSGLALSALNRAPNIPAERIKPSEFAIINAARQTNKKPNDTSLSIFHKKQPINPDPCEKEVMVSWSDVTYDGLGGHSKPDVFPNPKIRTFKHRIPVLCMKHKLKRLTPPSGSQDIGKLFDKMNQ